ncbi:MAG: hypothetical protein ACTIJN_11490, partial [Microbacterium gubbeenense]|uniref:hypothetical protein n=1 Tax=Microbacterium gubbeenense TaxID=159896 RepID=UPI003F980D7F
MPRHLIAILHSRPAGDGARTLRRVDIARKSLECESFSVANIYPATLGDVNQIPDLDESDVWAAGLGRPLHSVRTLCESSVSI